jgi:hypothetical protein
LPNVSCKQHSLQQYDQCIPSNLQVAVGGHYAAA